MCRKLSLIALVIMFATVSLMAQTTKLDPKEKAAELKAKLTLTDDQTAKVTQIYSDLNAKIEEQKTAKGTAKVTVKALKAEAEKEIEGVLTAAQKMEYEKMLAAKPAKSEIKTAKADKKVKASGSGK